MVVEGSTRICGVRLSSGEWPDWEMVRLRRVNTEKRNWKHGCIQGWNVGRRGEEKPTTMGRARVKKGQTNPYCGNPVHN